MRYAPQHHDEHYDAPARHHHYTHDDYHEYYHPHSQYYGSPYEDDESVWYGGHDFRFIQD